MLPHLILCVSNLKVVYIMIFAIDMELSVKHTIVQAVMQFSNLNNILNHDFVFLWKRSWERASWVSSGSFALKTPAQAP